MAFIVGLTGGIGSGKSTVAEIFRDLGVDIVDTDAIARDLTAKGQAALISITREFGNNFILPNGSMDRTRMRNLVFADSTARAKLEGILHPLIRHAVKDKIARGNGVYTILVVPLLFETDGYNDLIDTSLVVDCDTDQQIARTHQRSGLSQQEVEAIMATQLVRAERLRRADDVVLNTTDLSSLKKQIVSLHRKYLDRAVHSAEAAAKN